MIVSQKCIAQGSEHSRFVTAEAIRKNRVEGGPGFRFMFVMPMRVIPAMAVLNFVYREAEQE